MTEKLNIRGHEFEILFIENEDSDSYCKPVDRFEIESIKYQGIEVYDMICSLLEIEYEYIDKIIFEELKSK